MTPFPLEHIQTNSFGSSIDLPEYIGRFAPSPSGPLHFGSMVAAIGSYLQAKANNGLWLVRIEDIDPPREVAGASDDILRTLESFGLFWDGPVIYQSQRHQSYHLVLDWLKHNHLGYYCRCTRKQINQSAPYPGVYPGNCRTLDLDPSDYPAGCSLRFRNSQPITQFIDLLQGQVHSEVPSEYADDFIIHRKDGLFAYQLAVVVDDIGQGISEIVRGSDLLTTTLHQMTLYQAFGQQPVKYLHLPVAATEPGRKLSKQNHAKAVDKSNIEQTLIEVLKFLGMKQASQLAGHNKADILTWAVKNWAQSVKPRAREILI